MAQSTEDSFGMKATLMAATRACGVPFDSFTVRAYADWLMEQGLDELADAYLAVAAKGVRPFHNGSHNGRWSWGIGPLDPAVRSNIPGELFDLVHDKYRRTLEYKTLDEAVLAVGGALVGREVKT